MTAESSTALRVDSSWWRRRRGDSDVVIAGSPLRWFRIGRRGHEAIDAIERGEVPGPDSRSLLERLQVAGAVHPLPLPTDARAEVTVVIPSHDEDPASLRRLVDAFGSCADVIVVDDGSRTPTPTMPGARNIRRERPGGPAAARNAGLSEVSTRFVVFCDADVEIDPDEVGDVLPQLLGHLADTKVALVAPRVVSTPGADLLAAYENVESPLDMGDEPALVRPGSRVSYVPSAFVVADTAALRRVGGFDEGLRFGEDVDLVWRLVAAGDDVRYEPRVRVRHRHRDSWTSWWRQRVGYGSSAVDLDERHPGNVAPLRINRWSLVTWLAPAFLPRSIGWCVGACAAIGSTARLARKLGGHGEARAIAVRLAGRGNVFAARSIAEAITRTWWPIAVLVALFSRRSRRVVIAAMVLRVASTGRRGDPRIDPVRHAALRLADDVAYGWGVWKGCAARRRFGALRPRID